MGKCLCTFLFLFVCSIACASELRLKEKLAQASPGSFLVIEQNKTFTFFHIHDASRSNVVIEEVSIPAATFAKAPLKWKEWFEKGAPGHTSWIMSQVNLETGAFEETFSFTHKGWIDMADSNPFFTTLLCILFREVPENERRRVGLPPGYNKVDHRPIWNPRLTVDGHILTNTHFFAYKARWPADGTELSRKNIEISLPANPIPTQESVRYPVYFPYWMEVDGKIGSVKVRVVDSGMHAHSPKGGLPKRSPQLIGETKIDEQGIHFQLKSPLYYREFILLVEESGAIFGHTFPLPCETFSDDKGLVSLLVSKEELKKLNLQGKSYRFLISPKEDPSIVLETNTPVKIDTL